MKNGTDPKTLLDMINYFSDEMNAFKYLCRQRWGDTVSCPRCQSEKVKLIETRRVFRCNGCRKQFSVKVGTIFEDSPISLTKWLPAVWLIANAKNGISSYELHRSLGVTQKTAWFMLHRIRVALQNGSFELLEGHVEADETYVGGRSEFMHHKVREARRLEGRMGKGGHGKTIVAGVIQRNGNIVAKVIQRTNRTTMLNFLMDNVHGNARLFTDQARGYEYAKFYWEHQVVNHAIEYVRGNVHTNSMENFWSLLKRGLKGTYVSVDPIHLERYVGEQVFRFNQRKDNDGGRFKKAIRQIVGRRLTYAELTGKVLATR